MAARVPGRWGSVLILIVLYHGLALVRPGEGINLLFYNFIEEVAECFAWAAENERPLIGDSQREGFPLHWKGGDGRGLPRWSLLEMRWASGVRPLPD